MRILILGTSGMLGSAVFRQFDGYGEYEVWGLLRSKALLAYFSEMQRTRIVAGIDVLDESALAAAFERVRPDVVINCIGLIKQKAYADDPLTVLPINAMLPHRLAAWCAANDARLVHISTDCVFSGRKGQYTENDHSDAEDLYGQSKYIGELRDTMHAITLRTSIIGRELNSNRALVDWFLTQQVAVHGFTRSIFSGLTAIELARVMRDVVLPNKALHGLYHVSAIPISKFELLKLIAAQYGKNIEVVPDDELIIDRSLDSSKFRRVTGYQPPSWEDMVRIMYESEK
jgi:dTDP-4-dehydrorhamnose reductase